MPARQRALKSSSVPVQADATPRLEVDPIFFSAAKLAPMMRDIASPRIRLRLRSFPLRRYSWLSRDREQPLLLAHRGCVISQPLLFLPSRSRQGLPNVRPFFNESHPHSMQPVDRAILLLPRTSSGDSQEGCGFSTHNPTHSLDRLARI